MWTKPFTMIWRLVCQKQVSGEGTSNYITYSSLLLIPAFGTRVLIWGMRLTSNKSLGVDWPLPNVSNIPIDVLWPYMCYIICLPDVVTHELILLMAPGFIVLSSCRMHSISRYVLGREPAVLEVMNFLIVCSSRNSSILTNIYIYIYICVRQRADGNYIHFSLLWFIVSVNQSYLFSSWT